MNRNTNIGHRAWILLLPLLLTSCEKMFTRPYDPKGSLASKGKILIESVLESHQDTLRITSGITTALSNGHTADARLLDMTLQVNGKEIELFEDQKTPKQFLNQKNFYALCSLQADDDIRLAAGAPSIEPVTAQVKMGKAFPKINITPSIEWTDKTAWGTENDLDKKNQCLKFDITLDETPQPGDYYAVQVWRHMEIVGHDDNVLIPNENYYHTILLDDLYTLESSDFPMSGRHYDLCGKYNEGDLQVFDRYYTNSEGKAHFSVYVKHIKREVLSDLVYIQPRYKIVISRISRELYNSIEKFNSIDGLWELGLGPHAHEFTNINGGVGLLATKLDYVSDWIREE